eukprot:gene10363-1877_t
MFVRPDLLVATAVVVSRVDSTLVDTFSRNLLDALTADPPLSINLSTAASAYIERQSPDGTWSDINYDDPDGRDPTAVAAVWRATADWVAKDYPNTNWWWQDFGVPSCLAKLLVLVPNATLAQQASISMQRVYRSTDTGANAVWQGVIGAVVGAALQDPDLIQRGLAHVYGVLVPGTGDGIQTDYSFHQHGALLYLGWGYGAIFTTNALQTALLARGTNMPLPPQGATTLRAFLQEGQRLAVMGTEFDWTACGRLETYFTQNDTYGVDQDTPHVLRLPAQGHYHYFAAFLNASLMFPTFTPPYTTAISVGFGGLLGAQQDPALSTIASTFGSIAKNGLSLNKYFPRSDYMVHRRPGFAFGLRMFSNRTLNSECGNNEGKQNQMVADGILTTYTYGDEYKDIFPVFNWTLLPGLTAVQTGALPCDPTACSSCVTDVTHPWFVAGLSDGKFGAAGMVYAHVSKGGNYGSLFASKAWYFFDDLAVSLVSNVTWEDSSKSAATVMNQALSTGQALVWEDPSNLTARPVVVSNESLSFLPSAAVWHNQVLYGSLPGATTGSLALTVGSKAQYGSWDLITQGPNTTVSKQVFSAFLASQTQGYSAAFLVAPGTPAEGALEAFNRHAQTLSVVANSPGIQSVCRKHPLLMSVVFQLAGDADGSNQGCMHVQANAAAVVMVSASSRVWCLSVSRFHALSLF